MAEVKWRKWFRILHRDVGYVAVALTLAYGLSGLAVNHIEDWNPNYRLTRADVDIGPIPTGTPDAMAAHVVASLAIDEGTVRGHFLEHADDLRVFLVEGQEVRIAPSTGRGHTLHLARRSGLYEANALHLNSLKGAWTYVADVFAIALMFLALTGMSMMKGADGFWGRGKWFVLAGLSIPVAFIVYLLD